MHKREKAVRDEPIIRYNPSINEGLSSEQVEERIKNGHVNITDEIVGKTTWEILRSSVFTFFNILLFILAGLMIYANVNDGDPETPWYRGLFFVLILLSNIVIGLIQDIRTKHLMVKMSILNRQKVTVIREGKEQVVDCNDLVLDDIMILKAGEQISSDAIILDGFGLVDESCLTGESENIIKNVGDNIYAGTIVHSGKFIAVVDKVGKHNRMQILEDKAKVLKRNASHILKSLKILFRILGIIIISLAIIVLVTNFFMGSFSTQQDFVNIINPFTGQFVAMIPAGLNLLTSMALVSGVISLHKKGATVQELYSIEMLARTDVLCVDKTGTITDGTLKVVGVEPFGVNKLTEKEIGQIISNIVTATGDSNVTATALAEHFKEKTNIPVSKVLPFNSENKYSGVTLSTGVTYIMGAFEKMNISSGVKEEFENKINEWSKKGYRVISLSKGLEPISSNEYTSRVEPTAIIVMQDNIKKDAAPIFKWFNDNSVNVKVISGDNAVTVSETAKKAGILGADRYISLEGKSLDEVKEIANDYNVFGRVSPEQKEAIVVALQAQGKTVAMTGDGVNDILALKKADCSIAMSGGAQAAKNVSHVVLQNNNFSAMPSIVAEGRRVINNLTRTGSLFLTKTLFAITMSILFWVVSIVSKNTYSYPFSTSNMIIWEVLGIGLSAFFIALEPDNKPIKHGFLRNILKRAIPGAVLIISGVLICFGAYLFQENGVMYTGVDSFGYNTANSGAMKYGATSLAVLTFSALSFVILFIVCRPLNKYRTIVISSALVVGVVSIMIAVFATPRRNIFGINFELFTYENAILFAAIVVVLGAIMICAQTLIYNLKSERKKKNDQSK